jgi:putative lysine transport system substrate-binding protein
MPTAQGALAAYPDMSILDFSGTAATSRFPTSDVNIGISVRKGNTVSEGRHQQAFSAR